MASGVPEWLLQFYNNHVIANTLTRKDGLFGFNAKSMDFSTVSIHDNIIECNPANPRPLFRNEASFHSRIRNNVLKNVTDTDKYGNPASDAKAGPIAPLEFRCGVDGEYLVKGWKTFLAK